MGSYILIQIPLWISVKKNYIYLIHDAAQSYGIDESLLTYSSGLVYSFGPGKSSTAAGGALVKGLDKKFYQKHSKTAGEFSRQGFSAKLFLRSRIYGYRFTIKDKLLQKIFSRRSGKGTIRRMTDFQRRAATAALISVKEKADKRRERYRILESAIKANNLLEVPFDDGKGLYFKIVVRIKNGEEKFKEYLRKEEVPFFSLWGELNEGKVEQNKYPEFMKSASSFLELSTEASIPLDEIERVAMVLRKYS